MYMITRVRFFHLLGPAGEKGEQGVIGDPGANGTVLDANCECISEYHPLSVTCKHF